MTAKPETEARPGETTAGDTEGQPASQPPPAESGPRSLVDGDVPTAPGIGPRGSEAAAEEAPAAAPADEAALTTPFVRAPEGGDVAAKPGVMVDVDGGWTLDAEKTEPHQPVAAPVTATVPPAPTAPIVEAVAKPPTEETKTTPIVPVEEPPKSDEPAEAPPASPVASPAPADAPSAAASPPPASTQGTLPGVVPAPAEPAPPPEPAAPVVVAPTLVPMRQREPIDIRVFGRTDVGLVREHNEDNFLIADLSTGNRSLLPEVRRHFVGPRGSLFVVCDGMGGAAAGEVASLLAVDTIYERLRDSPAPRSGVDLARTMVEAIEEAGRRIFTAAKLDRTRRGMGTTVTGACLLDGTLYLAQVGDSRAYAVRGQRIELVTRDQSLVNQLIEAGQLTEEEAEAFEHSNIILQALGTAAEVSVDVTHVPLRRGDILVVCSDGLSGAVTAEQMKDVVLTTPEPIEACKKLTEMANAAGGHDNITVIVAQFDGEGLPAPAAEDHVVFQRVSLPSSPRASQPTPLPPAPSGSPPYRQTLPDIDLAQTETDDPADERRRSGGITIFLLLLALLVGAAVAYVLFSGMLTASTAAPMQQAVAAQVPPAQPALAPLGATPVPIVSRAAAAARFRSSVANGRVHVDGVDHGALAEGQLQLTLSTGDHEVSVVVDGRTVVSRRVVVVDGADNQFVLGEPEPQAPADDAPAPLAPVAPVPTGVAPPADDSAAPPPPRPRPPARPREDPGKSPQRLVPPQPAGVERANPYGAPGAPGQQF